MRRVGWPEQPRVRFGGDSADQPGCRDQRRNPPHTHTAEVPRPPLARLEFAKHPASTFGRGFRAVSVCLWPLVGGLLEEIADAFARERFVPKTRDDVQVSVRQVLAADRPDVPTDVVTVRLEGLVQVRLYSLQQLERRRPLFRRQVERGFLGKLAARRGRSLRARPAASGRRRSVRSRGRPAGPERCRPEKGWP